MERAVWVPGSRKPVQERCPTSSPTAHHVVCSVLLIPPPHRSCRDLFSHLMSSPVPFQLRSHYTSVAGTATNARKNCYKNMHAFLTSLSFSFALSFILLSSAAFLKNGNEHWFIRPTILT